MLANMEKPRSPIILIVVLALLFIVTFFSLRLITSCLEDRGMAPEPHTADEKQLESLGQIFYDIPYKHAGGNLHLDLYMPYKTAYERAPFVLFAHGGSFIAGDKYEVQAYIFAPILETLREHGFAVASVQYRFVDGTTVFPENVTDVRDAIRFLVKHAGDYGLDPMRVATWGSSAGGTLALTAAYLEDDLSDPDPDLAEVDFSVFAVIDVNGPIDLVRSQDKSQLDDYFSQYLRAVPYIYFGDRDPLDLAAAVSPNRVATKDAPPTLILHGRQDEIVDVSESELLAGMLGALEVPNELFVLEQAAHGLLPASDSDIAAIREKVLNFLLEYLP